MLTQVSPEILFCTVGKVVARVCSERSQFKKETRAVTTGSIRKDILAIPRNTTWQEYRAADGLKTGGKYHHGYPHLLKSFS